MHKKIEKLDKILKDIDIEINGTIKLALSTTTRILIKSEANIDFKNNDIEKTSYQKALDYIFNTNMKDIFYNYMCIANDKIYNDEFNGMRTVKLNTFETGVLHFNMTKELKSRLIYEGYSKTIKYFTSILHTMNITNMKRDEEYIGTLNTKFKEMFY
jgi:hypothetical protein